MDQRTGKDIQMLVGRLHKLVYQTYRTESDQPIFHRSWFVFEARIPTMKTIWISGEIDHFQGLEMGIYLDVNRFKKLFVSQEM